MKVYIIDTYNKYMRQGNEKSIHWVHGYPYCIREVEMEWGLPILEDNLVEQQVRPEAFGVYEDYDAALEYMKDMKRLNGGYFEHTHE